VGSPSGLFGRRPYTFAFALTLTLTLLRLFFGVIQVQVLVLVLVLRLSLSLGLGLGLGLGLSWRSAALGGCTGSGSRTGTTAAASTAASASAASAASASAATPSAASSSEGDTGDHCQGYCGHQRYDSLPVHLFHLTFMRAQPRDFRAGPAIPSPCVSGQCGE
jgi:hypothetical protein